MGLERAPFAQAGRDVFDGDGTMRGEAIVNFNGAVLAIFYSGTYTVEPDCTGAVTFIDDDGIATHYDIAIEDGGAEFGFVQTDSNFVTAAFERRRTASQGRCSLATLKGNYVYAGDGFNISGPGSTERTPFATAGREVYSGDGRISGVDTTSTNGEVVRSTYTATYTLNQDCGGTYTYDNDPANPYALFADASGAEFAYVATGTNRIAAGFERRR
jgi:hypothetical protein